MRFSVTRSESEDVGEFYREIGCKNAEGTYGATAYLVSHALLMDMNGNPTVIEKNEHRYYHFLRYMVSVCSGI